jgi:predicted small lipoprotein YifL
MIAAFVKAFAGFSVRKNWVVLVFIASILSGCGYKGALYIPDAPEKTTQPPSTAKPNDNETPSASLSGDSN